MPKGVQLMGTLQEAPPPPHESGTAYGHATESEEGTADVRAKRSTADGHTPPREQTLPTGTADGHAFDSLLNDVGSINNTTFKHMILYMDVVA
jgi:hypothetical protein